MAPSIFISYSRKNQYLAGRLKLDLERCGFEPWMDVSHIAPGNPWREELRQAIDRSEFVFLLWSPEADESDEVFKEFDYARHHTSAKRLWMLRLSDKTDKIRPEYQDLQHIDFTADYWQGLKHLLHWLGAERPRPFSPCELLGSDTTVAEAGKHFCDVEQRSWPIHAGENTAAQTFVRLPLAPSGYAMSWLVTRADASLRAPSEMQVVLNFTGSLDRPAVHQVLEFLVRNGIAPRMLLIEGPQSERGYELPNEGAHVWHDCVDLSVRMIERCCAERTLSFFLHAPQALVLPIAARLLVKSKFHVYHWNPGAPPERTYSRVYSS